MTEQQHAALQVANARRAALRDTKRALRTGALTLEEVMASPPAELDGIPLVDIVRWCRSDVRWARGASMERVGQEAVFAGVNLMVPLGRASVRSRGWVAERGGVSLWMRC